MKRLFVLLLVLVSLPVVFGGNVDLFISSNSSHVKVFDDFGNEYVFLKSEVFTNRSKSFFSGLDVDGLNVECSDVSFNCPVVSCPTLPNIPECSLSCAGVNVSIPEVDDGALRECIASLDKQVNPPGGESGFDSDWLWYLLIGFLLVLFFVPSARDRVLGFIRNRDDGDGVVDIPVEDKRVKKVEKLEDKGKVDVLSAREVELQRREFELDNRRRELEAWESDLQGRNFEQGVSSYDREVDDGGRSGFLDVFRRYTSDFEERRERERKEREERERKEREEKEERERRSREWVEGLGSKLDRLKDPGSIELSDKEVKQKVGERNIQEMLDKVDWSLDSLKKNDDDEDDKGSKKKKGKGDEE